MERGTLKERLDLHFIVLEDRIKKIRIRQKMERDNFPEILHMLFKTFAYKTHMIAATSSHGFTLCKLQRKFLFKVLQRAVAVSVTQARKLRTLTSRSVGNSLILMG